MYSTCIYLDSEYQYTALPIVFVVLHQRIAKGRENDQRVPGMATCNLNSPIFIYTSHSCHRKQSETYQSPCITPGLWMLLLCRSAFGVFLLYPPPLLHWWSLLGTPQLLKPWMGMSCPNFHGRHNRSQPGQLQLLWWPDGCGNFCGSKFLRREWCYDRSFLFCWLIRLTWPCTKITRLVCMTHLSLSDSTLDPCYLILIWSYSVAYWCSLSSLTNTYSVAYWWSTKLADWCPSDSAPDLLLVRFPLVFKQAIRYLVALSLTWLLSHTNPVYSQSFQKESFPW